jgi:alpha-N-acetylglucosamine transferase
MKDSGCCGAYEFVKLWAYTLTDYHRVVHLDMDTVIYKNMVRVMLMRLHSLTSYTLYLYLSIDTWLIG